MGHALNEQGVEDLGIPGKGFGQRASTLDVLNEAADRAAEAFVPPTHEPCDVVQSAVDC
jgi:hypothetical protein